MAKELKTSARNTLHELGYKIFLDRYAQKDMTRSTLSLGDTVIVVVDSKTGQREIGTITSLNLPEVKVELLGGEVVVRNIESIDKPLETDPAQMMERVAAGVAAVETTPELRELWQERFRWLLEDWKFIPAGRILAAAGTGQALTFYNCYVIPSPQDSREGIIETLRQMTEIMSRGGGVGINISSLRPRHAYVKGVNGRSNGPVAWGGLYSFVTGLIEQGGSRRGALMLILNDWHPAVLEFINSKRETGNFVHANISVGISDKFMDAVKADDDWELMFPDTSHKDYDEVWGGDLEAWASSGRTVVKHEVVKARELWNALIESAWASAEPGVWFRERSNKLSNSWYYNPLISTNPCGEQPLPAWAVCNLGAINLARFYDDETHDVDWENLGQVARYATRFLDNVIDSTAYFFDENQAQQLNERRIGLNNMGLAELMIRLGIRYGSEESVAFIDKLYNFLATEAYTTSVDLAQEKGVFPKFDAKRFLESGYMQNMPERIQQAVSKHGIRNVTLLTQAPTGTTGTMIGTSTGIEPFYSWSYYRKSRLGLHEERIPLVEEWFESHPDVSELPEHFVTAMDLSPMEHIRVQAAIQRWVDSGISKTCNIPAHYTVEQTRELYEYMYELGCKGGTIYRDGSRDEQVLTLKDESGLNEPSSEDSGEASIDSSVSGAAAGEVATPVNVYPRTRKLTGVTISRKTPFGTAFITMNSDEQGNPFEVFITIGKAGSDLQADAEGLGRLISLQLRTTAPQNRRQMLKLIIDQLQGIGGSRSVGFGPARVTSVPDGIASALKEHYLFQHEGEQPAPSENQSEPSTARAELKPHQNGQHPPKGFLGADMCPACGTVSLIRAEGCRKCLTCAYSEC